MKRVRRDLRFWALRRFHCGPERAVVGTSGHRPRKPGEAEAEPEAEEEEEEEEEKEEEEEEEEEEEDMRGRGRDDPPPLPLRLLALPTPGALLERRLPIAASASRARTAFRRQRRAQSQVSSKVRSPIAPVPSISMKAS